MSGHSKWDNIKRRKGAQDKKRGKIFSKISRLIVAAVKEGASDDPGFNPKLRLAMERARAENMPKDNILRAIKGAAKDQSSMEEVVLEGYAPGGVAVMVEALTDNRQRTIQELKSIFQKNGGSLSEPGAVAFQFEKKGLLEVAKLADEEKMLKLIDLGAEDIEEKGESTLVWVSTSSFAEMESKIKDLGIEVKVADLVMKPKSKIDLDEGNKKRMADFLEAIEDHNDVLRVFSTFNASN